MPEPAESQAPEIVAEEVQDQAQPNPTPPPSPVTEAPPVVPTSSAEPEKEKRPKKKNFWLLLIGFLVVVAGALVIFSWFSGRSMETSNGIVSPLPDQPQLPTIEPTPGVDDQIEQLESVGTENDLTTLEQDLQQTNLENVDEELEVIGDELATE